MCVIINLYVFDQDGAERKENSNGEEIYFLFAGKLLQRATYP